MNNILFFFELIIFRNIKLGMKLLMGNYLRKKITFLFSLFAILDSLGRRGESCVLTLFRVVGKGKGCYRRRRARDRRGDLCMRRASYVAGVGNGITYWYNLLVGVGNRVW